MSSTPGTIVVGIDGSAHASRALRWAVRQAVSEHRPLTLVHAVHSVNPSFVEGAIVDSRTSTSVLDVAAQKVLDDARRVVAKAAPTLEVHEVSDLADPREVLLQLSEQASMLVVGSRGRGHVRSLLLGSVSVALTRHARCPVVVVRPEHVGVVRNGVVVGVDATPEARPVLEFAYRQASLHDLPLTVLDCVTDRHADRTSAGEISEEQAHLDPERLALSEAMAGMSEKYPEVRATVRLAHDLPREALVRLGDRMDLIVVGAHQDNRFSQALFGSVSVAVVESAPCPVAVVPLSVTA